MNALNFNDHHDCSQLGAVRGSDRLQSGLNLLEFSVDDVFGGLSRMTLDTSDETVVRASCSAPDSVLSYSARARRRWRRQMRARGVVGTCGLHFPNLERFVENSW